MNMNENYEEIIEFIENLFHTPEGRKFVRWKSNNTFRGMTDSIFTLNDYDHNGTWSTYGATKGVIGDDNWDYVIKIPMNRDDYDPIDYCALELANYEIAKSKHIENMFAAIERIGRVEGIPIYIQEKVECNSNKVIQNIADIDFQNWLDYDIYEVEDCEELDKDDDESCRDYFNNNVFDEYEADDWEHISAFFDYDYSFLEAESLFALLNELDINDIHSGNVGFLNGRIILVDYSGYERFYFLKNNNWKNFNYNKKMRE